MRRNFLTTVFLVSILTGFGIGSALSASSSYIIKSDLPESSPKDFRPVKLMKGEPTKTPPIIFIVLESTRADHIGPCYGYQRTTAPSICELAEEGVLFEQAYSQGTRTLISLPVLMTSLPPSSVGSNYNNWTSQMPNEIVTFPEVLREHNYSPKTNPDRQPNIEEKGFLQGFQFTSMNPSTVIKNTDSSEELFLWRFIHSTHTPYAPSPQFRQWDNVSVSSKRIQSLKGEKWNRFRENHTSEELINLYDAGIQEADAQVGRLIEVLKEEGVYNESLIILTSDHGEAFGEHGIEGFHRGPPYEEVIHVPLIIKFPDEKYAGKREETVVGHNDIPHTIFDWTGIEGGFGLLGSSLIPVLDEGKGDSRFILSADNSNHQWMVRKGDLKYFVEDLERHCSNKYLAIDVLPQAYLVPEIIHQNFVDYEKELDGQLFNLRQDPVEKKNVVDKYPSKAFSLKRQLCRIYDKSPSVQFNSSSDREPSPELRKRLEDLGYLH